MNVSQAFRNRIQGSHPISPYLHACDGDHEANGLNVEPGENFSNPLSVAVFVRTLYFGNGGKKAAKHSSGGTPVLFS